jgi:uncharacterized protein
MIIDTNAYLGHFAFRRLRHNTADELLRLMDAKGIDRAVVSSAAAITYRNAQSGNEEVANEIRRHGDRLIGFAVINPFYAGWEDDLEICQGEFGMKGLRVYPKWHNYSLTDARCREMIAAATERKMIVSIPSRVEDYRERSWLADIPDLPLAELTGLAKAHSKARFLFVNGAGFTNTTLGHGDSGLPANYWIEISRLRALQENDIGQLLKSLGPNRVVFGTGMPFNAPDPALVKMEVLEAPEDVKEQIRWKNAAGLLEMKL